MSHIDYLISNSQNQFKKIIGINNIYFNKNKIKYNNIIHFSLWFKKINNLLYYDLYIINNLFSFAFIHYGCPKKILKCISNLNKKKINIEIFFIETFDIIRLKYKVLECFLLQSLSITKMNMDILNINFKHVKNILTGKFLFFLEETKNNKKLQKQKKTIKNILINDKIYKRLYLLTHYTKIIYNSYNKKNHDYFIIFNKYFCSIE